MGEYKTIQAKQITLEYLRKYHCVNCQNYSGKNHDYNHKRCERCMSYISKEVK